MRKLLIPCLLVLFPAIASAQRNGPRLAASADGKTVVVSYDNSYAYAGVNVFDTESGKVRTTFLVKTRTGGIALTRSGKLLAVVTGGGADPLVLVDPQSGKVMRPIGGVKNGDSVDAIAFSPDGKLLACGIYEGGSKGGPKVEVFDVASGASKWSAAADYLPSSIAWSPDGGRLVVDEDSALRIFDAKGKELKKFGDGLGFVTWSPDGKLIASTGNRLTVRLYNASSGEVVAETSYNTGDKPDHEGDMLVFSPDGGWIGASTRSGIDWYTAPSLTLKYTWQDPLGGTRALAYGAGETVYALADSRGAGKVRALDGGASSVRVLQTLAPMNPDDVAPETDTPPVAEVRPPANRTPPPKGSDKALKAVVAAAIQVLSNGSSSDLAALGKDCVQAVDAALAKKMPGSTEIKLKTGKEIAGSEHGSEDGNTIQLTTLDNIKAVVCLPAIGKGAARSVEAPASLAAVWLGKFAHPDDWKRELGQKDLLRMALDFGNECHAAVEAARKAGVDDSTPIDFNSADSGVDSPASLADVDSQICQAAIKQAGDRVNAQSAEKDALYAPYLKVLSGDKARIFVEQNMMDDVACTGRCSGMYGKKGKKLKTPADFKNSTVWYDFVHLQDVAVPTWQVHGVIFNGMKQVGLYDKQGPGDNPPPSAFK